MAGNWFRSSHDLIYHCLCRGNLSWMDFAWCQAPTMNGWWVTFPTWFAFLDVPNWPKRRQHAGLISGQLRYESALMRRCDNVYMNRPIFAAELRHRLYGTPSFDAALRQRLYVSTQLWCGAATTSRPICIGPALTWRLICIDPALMWRCDNV